MVGRRGYKAFTTKSTKAAQRRHKEVVVPIEDADKSRANERSHEVIGAAIEVHRHLGPGLLESAYQACLCRELFVRGIPFECQVPIALDYKGSRVECAYRIDILVDQSVVLELKSVERLEPIHEAQLLTYLRLSGLWLGLLMNFNVKVLKQGIRRLVN
jgi:GxxExxY protein